MAVAALNASKVPSSPRTRDSPTWIANKKPPQDGRPRDLGYYVGYRITKSYYDRASDKAAAMRAILSVKDPKVFLAFSGYSP